MLKKFKAHCNNPITWGSYYKLCGISFLVSLAIGTGMAIKYAYDFKKLDNTTYFINEGTEEDEAE